MHVKEILDNRIMVLDGAMGTMIQQYGLTEKDFRGERFSDIGILQKGNNDLLCLTQPQIITAIHQVYLDAGADIIETNSFNSTRISMADYGMQGLITEINFEAARLARNIADDYTRQTPICSRLGRSYQQDLLHVSRRQQSGFPRIDIR